MAEYKLTHSPTVIRTADQANIPDDPDNADRQEYDRWLADGGVPDPADPLPVHYAATENVNRQATTTDASDVEIFRFPVPQKRSYQGNLTIFGIDRGNFVSRTMEGRFAWKRTTTATAVMVGINVISTLGEAASSTWAPNAVAQGSDIVFTVRGAAGRTVDWQLTGVILGYAPDGTTGSSSD